MPEITIRPYIPEDRDTSIEVFRASVRRIGLLHYSLAQVVAWAPDEIDATTWNARRLSRTTWVAEIGGKTVGFSDLEADGHLDMLFVHPDFQRQGVASALLRRVESTGVEGGLSRLYTESSIGARPFFERSGFNLIAAQTVLIRGEILVNFRMEKALSQVSRNAN
jgi:putative acetyltransferase